MLQKAMKSDGVVPDTMTHKLMASIGKGGISAIENQQVATTALAAAVAAAGSLIMKAGIIWISIFHAFTGFFIQLVSIYFSVKL